MLLDRLENISKSIEKKAGVKKQLRVKTALSTRSSVLQKDSKKLSDAFLKLVEFEKLGLKIEVPAHAYVISKNISIVKNKIQDDFDIDYVINDLNLKQDISTHLDALLISLESALKTSWKTYTKIY